jgi:hypothetical protein
MRDDLLMFLAESLAIYQSFIIDLLEEAAA